MNHVKPCRFWQSKSDVVVDAFDFEGLSASDKEKITALLEDPVPTTVLILVVDKEEFLPKKSAGAKKLVALCDKAGAVLELKKRETSDLVRFVRSKLESRGCTITKDCCDLLIERCEKDMLTLNAEIENWELMQEEACSRTMDSQSLLLYR